MKVFSGECGVISTLPRVTAESKCNQSYAYMQIHINLTSWNSSREGNQWALWAFSRQGNYPSQLLVYNKFQNTNIYAHTYTHITSYTNSLPSYWILWYKESLLWRMWGMRVYTTLPREAPSYQMHVLLNPSNFHRNHITLKTKTLHYTATDESGVQKNVVYSNHKMWQPLTIWSKPRQHSQKAAKTDI